jgi:superfamily II DNA or RNA helicase
VPLTDVVVRDHLLGDHVIGVYPLLPDETCWFLAADFDGDSWQDDIAAFRDACRSQGVPVAIERSRSGNGGHAWFFFEAPTSAAGARKLGSFLLTETLDRRPGIGFKSYDRLFPNQDTMPKGGFGNLIALPLQKKARDKGCTVFLDDQMLPFDDQWTFLASVPRLAPALVDGLVHDATRSGRILGVRAAPDFEDASAPWERPPSGRLPDQPIVLPYAVKGVLRQQLFVETAGLPPRALMRLKRIAAFQNPEFFKHERMRLSTARIPRVIACAEEFPDHLALPRGCVDEVREFLEANGSRLVLEDLREPGQPIDVTFQGALTTEQDLALRQVLAHDIGVLVAPPGSGKTVAGVFLVAARRCSTLILVHRQPLMDQWIRQLSAFLGVPLKSIGQIGAGKRKPNGQLDVAMIQSLVHQTEVDDIVAGYGQVLVDECHHVSATSFEQVLKAVRARFVTGLTATPARRDGHHPILHMQCGPIRHEASRSDSASEFARILVCRETAFRWDGPVDAGIQAIYGALEKDDRRNTTIIDDVIGAVAQGRSPIVLTERRSHLDFLASKLTGFVRHLVVLHGGTGRREQRAVLERLASIPEGEERLLLATGRYIGEGFDDARLDTLFLVMPVSWRGTLVQYAGRLDRPHPGKSDIRIVDYVDREEPVLAKMFEKRQRGYRKMGYSTEPQVGTERLPGL